MNRYSIRNDANGPWVSLPNNGGELGDMTDTVCELNKLLSDAELARFERDECLAYLRRLVDYNNAIEAVHGEIMDFVNNMENADVEARREIENMERQRDQYAAMLCEAMRVVYATTCHGDSTDLIDRFEALELTPAISSENETSPSVGANEKANDN